jgi:hypothetical protein
MSLKIVFGLWLCRAASHGIVTTLNGCLLIRYPAHQLSVCSPEDTRSPEAQSAKLLDFTPIPDYEALSYTWGVGEGNTPIKIIEANNI